MDNDYRSPLWEIDPDMYIYNNVNLRNTIQCNIFYQTTFSEIVQIENRWTDNVFFICHLDIRRKKLGNFDAYL